MTVAMLRMMWAAWISVVLWGCGGIVVIDHENMDDSSVDGVGTGSGSSEGSGQTSGNDPGGVVACGSEAVAEGAHVCWRAAYDGRCVTDVCDNSVSYWRSECQGEWCSCFHNNTVEPTCTCQRAPDNACPGTTCCPPPWQG